VAFPRRLSKKLHGVARLIPKRRPKASVPFTLPTSHLKISSYRKRIGEFRTLCRIQPLYLSQINTVPITKKENDCTLNTTEHALVLGLI
jgi:hypothetical protein